MIMLQKFYELISRNATITLANTTLDKVYYEGSMKGIPDKYDDCMVEDFSVSNNGEFLFKIIVKK